MKEMVRIRHPHLGVTSEVSRAAFERRSQGLGWVLDDGTAPAADSEPSGYILAKTGPEVVRPPDSSTTSEPADEVEGLRARLTALDVKVDRRWSEKTLRSKLADAEAAE